MFTKEQKKAVMEFVAEKAILDDDAKSLVGMARFDLYYGPYSEEGYPGFEKAIERLREIEWPTLYLEAWSGYVSEGEPEGFKDEETGEWIEPEWSEIYRLEPSDVKRVILGRELASYV